MRFLYICPDKKSQIYMRKLIYLALLISMGLYPVLMRSLLPMRLDYCWTSGFNRIMESVIIYQLTQVTPVLE
jgi:hypothetical protein